VSRHRNDRCGHLFPDALEHSAARPGYDPGYRTDGPGAVRGAEWVVELPMRLVQKGRRGAIATVCLFITIRRVACMMGAVT
jgi:hypothetical protein